MNSNNTDKIRKENKFISRKVSNNNSYNENLKRNKNNSGY
jgi:hypothetical protein